MQEDSRTVSRFGLGTGGTAMLHAAQCAEPGLHDAMTGYALHVHHERHATRIVFEARVVQTMRRWQAKRLGGVRRWQAKRLGGVRRWQAKRLGGVRQRQLAVHSDCPYIMVVPAGAPTHW